MEQNTPKLTKSARDQAIRDEISAVLCQFLEITRGEHVIKVGNGKIAIPTLDCEGNETAYTIEIKVPRGERGGNGYDPYKAGEEWQDECSARVDKVAKRIERKLLKSKSCQNPAGVL